MNDFNFYLNELKVRKIKPDMEIAKSLLKDSKNRFNTIITLKKEMFSKIIFENVYDALRNISDAILFIDGYKSYSHEATISYLKKYKFEDSTLIEFDNFRQIRNQSKYYGKEIPTKDTENICKFYAKISPTIIRIIEEKINVQKNGQLSKKMDKKTKK